ncbi:MAG: FAD-dependent oxidoreductase [Ignavibacteriales bacterium]|nr:FAD-dependent oxidoreductase [Ignavibacteriales bacterium]
MVQLRKENLPGNAYTMVGFQTRLTYPEQKRIIGLIPALSSRQVPPLWEHPPEHLSGLAPGPRAGLEPRGSLQHSILAGQITGVEGYMESSATGILAGVSLLGPSQGQAVLTPGDRTPRMGALIHYITDRNTAGFQPTNTNSGSWSSPMCRRRAGPK